MSRDLFLSCNSCPQTVRLLSESSPTETRDGWPITHGPVTFTPRRVCQQHNYKYGQVAEVDSLGVVGKSTSILLPALALRGRELKQMMTRLSDAEEAASRWEKSGQNDCTLLPARHCETVGQPPVRSANLKGSNFGEGVFVDSCSSNSHWYSTKVVFWFEGLYLLVIHLAYLKHWVRSYGTPNLSHFFWFLRLWPLFIFWWPHIKQCCWEKISRVM